MPRITSLHLVAAALAVLLALPASAAPLFQDTFEAQSDGDPLDAAKWDVNDSDGSGTNITVDVIDEGALTNWASFEFTASAGNDDWGRALTDGTWSIQKDGPLTWTIDFRVKSGEHSTLVVPFVFDTTTDGGDEADGFKKADLAVTVEYDDGWAVLWEGNTPWIALKNAADDRFEPDMDNDHVQSLTLDLDKTKATASILGTYDGVNFDTYTATREHEISDLGTGRHVGIRVDNEYGFDVKVVQFDNPTLTPEPATLALLAVGGLVRVLGRRRRA